MDMLYYAHSSFALTTYDLSMVLSRYFHVHPLHLLSSGQAGQVTFQGGLRNLFKHRYSRLEMHPYLSLCFKLQLMHLSYLSDSRILTAPAASKKSSIRRNK